MKTFSLIKSGMFFLLFFAVVYHEIFISAFMPGSKHFGGRTTHRIASKVLLLPVFIYRITSCITHPFFYKSTD
ncbi:hypothetical protein CHCC20348_3924 [Bacillus paralicheniformis]|nr:hypothetical protein CHCC20348_3924 [Bacillus paralicheniformis]